MSACAAWWVEPTEGANFDADAAVFTVSADVGDGRRLVSIEVHIYTPEYNPLVGTWREEARFACSTGEEGVPQHLIGELRFRADGTFTVTWTPFEVYGDYWGTYAHESTQGRLGLSITGGNYVPEDIDSGGTFSIDEEGRLVLSDMWPGSPGEGTDLPGCGYRFLR